MNRTNTMPVLPQVYGNDPNGQLPDFHEVNVNTQSTIPVNYAHPAPHSQNSYSNSTQYSNYPNQYQNQQPQYQNNTNHGVSDWRAYARDLFRETDFDGNGVLDIEEFPILVEKVFQKFGMQPPGNAECRFLMEAFDANGDGEIDQFEYLEMMKALME